MTTTTTISAAPAAPSRSKLLHAGLWVGQVALALAFGMAGGMKATAPISELAQRMIWPGDVPAWLVRFIGVAELSAAFGLVLPAATRIKPGLTPLAAACLTLVVALAIPFHLVRGEPVVLVGLLPLGALALFVAWGRFGQAPIRPR